MIHAYNQLYLEQARASLGRMLDFAVYDYKFEIRDFWKLFLNSETCERFQIGESSVLAGKSGVELVYDILEDTSVKPRFTMSRSPEYWTGWALAYFQWYTNLSFLEIDKYVSIETILSLYNPYHEMDIRQFCDKMIELYSQSKPEVNLKMRRQSLNLSQKELSEITGIPLRTLQQYEQKRKNINKAQVEYIIALSKALYCKPEELLEII